MDGWAFEDLNEKGILRAAILCSRPCHEPLGCLFSKLQTKEVLCGLRYQSVRKTQDMPQVNNPCMKAAAKHSIANSLHNGRRKRSVAMRATTVQPHICHDCLSAPGFRERQIQQAVLGSLVLLQKHRRLFEVPLALSLSRYVYYPSLYHG